MADHTTTSNRLQAPAPKAVLPGASGRTTAHPARVALIGTFPPRSCGIATFTCDVRDKLATYHPDIAIDVHAMDAPDNTLVYDDDINVIAANAKEDYVRAARQINARGVDAVWVQHEFGIFGGPDGALITELVDRVAAPVIVTFHTVLAHPSDSQRAIIEHLLTRCTRAMVMSQHSRTLLENVYSARPDIVSVIEHGAPDRPLECGTAAKARRGLSGRKVLTTFGLLGPGKGLEHAIAALPAIVAEHPDVIYRILGATHPVLRAREGERYRDSLIALSRELGVADHVEWDNRFLAIDDLLDQLEACDIYLTPYPNLAQSTSGTLSYAVALGKAVVSTPYVHARELLADGVGTLVEPNDPAAIARAVNALLASPESLRAAQRRAWERGRSTIWPHFARSAARLVREAVAAPARPVSIEQVPSLEGVLAMSDGTGMLQHAIGIVPDRRHGYCLDDNARALMLMNFADDGNEPGLLARTMTYASFVQHAWNPDCGRFRNFMAFDRGWCEDIGSEDSNGRALWALGHTIEHNPHRDVRDWATGLFDAVAPALVTLQAPRALAFSALGLCARLRAGRARAALRDRVEAIGSILAHLLDTGRRPDWSWFEAVLGYDNPRLPQALVECGLALGRDTWIAAGLDALDWIHAQQTGPGGRLRPVGSETFGHAGAPHPFDQQPLEAQAAVEAAAVAYAASQDPAWLDRAEAAYQWFFGSNDRGVVLADLATGRCRDGITPRGRNENCGAESILAFHLAHHGLARLLRIAQPQGEAWYPANGTHAHGLHSGNDLGPTLHRNDTRPRHGSLRRTAPDTAAHP